jgi:large subunit ribosomal protein L9
MATASAKKILAENLKQKAHKEAKIVNDAKALAETLKALEIKITAKLVVRNFWFNHQHRHR